MFKSSDPQIRSRLTNEQREKFEKYYNWHSTFYFKIIEQNKIDLLLKIMCLDGKERFLQINSLGDLIILESKDFFNYIGHISEKNLDKILKVAKFI